MSFDRLAPHYGWMEAVLAAGILQRCRTAFLSQVGEPREVLSCGEGHGRFLVACQRALPEAQITCVDASPRMLQQARRRMQAAGQDVARVEWVCADLREWSAPNARFDLVATHFFLDCFSPEELRVVAGRISTAARPDARWLVSDFCVPKHGLSRVRARLIHWLMYVFFRTVTGLSARVVTSPDAFLAQNGFGLHARRFSEWGLLHADLWERTGMCECLALRHRPD